MSHIEMNDGCEFLNGLTMDELTATLESEQEVIEEKQRVIDGCRRRLAAIN